MGRKKASGLIYGPDVHHLDHIAPLCAALEIPLIVTDEEIERAAKEYYPHLKVFYFDYIAVGKELVAGYDVVIASLPRDLFDDAFFLPQKAMNKRMGTIWCPHGNSDKGFKAPFLEGLAKEKVVLVYGQKMIDFIKTSQALDHLKHIVVGNYRYNYFLEHHSFYAKKSLQVFSHFAKNQRTILYAPTWMDAEGSGSFFDACPHLAKQLPDSWNLLIKLHPNLERQFPLKVDEIIWKYEGMPNLVFLKDFPPIYPLLEKVDVYLGDMSSIGYDFLVFDKPMFFLNQTSRKAHDPGLYLYRCGTEIPPSGYSRIFQIIEEKLPTDLTTFSKTRKEVYRYTFEELEKHTLKERLELSYDLVVEEGLNFY
jgi:hypothetical protein